MATSRQRTARPHLGGAVQRTVLPSGLRVVTETMPGSRTLSIGVFINVGSRDESAEFAGSAHFLEHVLFKGTKKRTATQISRTFDAIGGDSNAYTAKEHTCFYAKVLDTDAQVAVETLLDMLAHSLITEPDFEQERHVILDEISMHGDDPLEQAYGLVATSIFAGNPLSRDVIGSKSSIRSLSRDEVYKFWKKHYRTSNIVVSAAGAVDHDWLVKQLSGWKGADRDMSRKPAVLAPIKASLATRSKPEMEQCNCVLSFRGLPRFDDRRFASDLLALILGGGMSSRLFTQVRENRGLAYHIDAATSAYGDAGQFIIEWMSGPTVVPEIMGLVNAEIVDIVTNGVTAEELARAKGQMRGGTLIAFESPDTRMMRLGKAELFGDERTMDEILDAFAATTAEQVQAIAYDILTKPPTMAIVGAKCDRGPIERLVNAWAKTPAFLSV
ncbi:MAG: M16 family metallopeptidase [Propionibacteriaceae bacterium]